MISPLVRRVFACANLLFASTCAPLFGQTPGLGQRPVVGAYFDHIFPAEPPAVATDWSCVVAFPNLTFINPVGITAIPGTNKLAVWEREGKVWAFDNNPAVSEKTLVMDLSSQCQGWDDSGLLGLAFHPDFANNHQVYVWYNWRGGLLDGLGDLGAILGSATVRPPTDSLGRARLSRFVLDANLQTTLANEDILIDQQKYTLWHNGGGMFFNPNDGFLYLATGADSDSFTQKIDLGFYSCLIRIDVDQRGGAISHAPPRRAYSEYSPNWPRYYVPNDNPFVGVPDALEETYAIGLRSPHRMSFDAVTGRTFIGDVGGSEWEEVDVIEPTDPAGLNFQWDLLEGGGADLPAPMIGINKQPLYSYSHRSGDGTCIIGGHVYRGSAFPELTGKYIFGDNISNNIWYLDETTTPVSKVLLTNMPKGPGPNSGSDYTGLSSFGIDTSGELYMCQLSSTAGKIYKLQRGGAAPSTPLPSTLSATGLFQDIAALTPSERLIPYEINLPFFSDHAIKSRFAAIPSDSTITFRSKGEWGFPAGSVFVKHFDFPASDIDTSVRRRLETRVLVKKDDGTVYGATYKWRADQSDADLLDGALTEDIPIATGQVGQFSGQDIGLPLLGGSTVRDGNILTLTGAGEDVWGLLDQCQFAQQVRSGDFDIAVRVKSVSQTAYGTKAGLMVRSSLAASAASVFAFVYPYDAPRDNNTGGYGLQYRPYDGGYAVDIPPASPQPGVSYPDTWLRMKRQGDVFIAYSSKDGLNWSEYGRQTVYLPSEIYFGPALTSHLVLAPATATFEVETRHQNWYYPSRQDCITCHNSQSGGVLGINARQFNRDKTFANGTVANQIRAWNNVGLFTSGPADGEIEAIEKLYASNDTTASLQSRARSYLDANCANCHRPGVAQALWDARYETPFEQQGIRYGEVLNDLGNVDSRVVVPQNTDLSVIHRRVSVVGTNQMPPVGRNTVDDAGVKLLTDWINSLQPDLLPKLKFTGNDVAISNEDFSPSLSDFTDFGAATPGVDTVTRTFVIQNQGNAPLTLSGTPKIVLQGNGASSFSVVAQPDAAIAAGSSFALQVLFNPATTGTKSAFIKIVSNDPNEPEMIFAIRGTATQHKLVAWWKLDETSSTVASDSSGNGRDGTLTAPNPAWTVGGRSEGTLRFTGEVNQSVTVQNHASLNPTAAITVAGWVMASDWNGNRRILQKGDTDNQYRLLAENNRLVWDISGAGRVDTALPAANTWFHVAATYEGRTLKIYLNGTLAVTKNAAGTIPTGTGPLYLGTKTPASVAGDHLNGYLDEMRVYSNALTAAEVSSLAQQSGSVSIAATDSVAQKGTSDSGVFTITRSGRTTAALPVTLSLVTGEGQAVLGQDFTFTPANGNVTIPAGQTTATLTVTPLAGSTVTGPLSVTVSVVEGTAYTVGSGPNARVQLLDNAWNQWKASAFGGVATAQSSAADDLADADGDGISTLTEAVLGGNPLVNDAQRLPDVKVEYVDGDYYLTSTYTRVTPLPAGISVSSVTATSPGASAWQPAVTVTGYPVDNLNGTETMKVRTQLPLSSGPRQFIRLEVTKP